MIIYACHLDVNGAAITHAISQYLISLILLQKLMKQVDLLPPSLKHLHFRQFLKNEPFMLVRMIPLTFCSTPLLPHWLHSWVQHVGLHFTYAYKFG